VPTDLQKLGEERGRNSKAQGVEPSLCRVCRLELSKLHEEALVPREEHLDILTRGRKYLIPLDSLNPKIILATRDDYVVSNIRNVQEADVAR